LKLTNCARPGNPRRVFFVKHRDRSHSLGGLNARPLPQALRRPHGSGALPNRGRLFPASIFSQRSFRSHAFLLVGGAARQSRTIGREEENLTATGGAATAIARDARAPSLR
jgi:hypothetical protein